MSRSGVINKIMIYFDGLYIVLMANKVFFINFLLNKEIYDIYFMLDRNLFYNMTPL